MNSSCTQVLFLRLPSYAGPAQPFRTAYSGDAGFDLYSSQDICLAPGQRAVVGTGIALALPEQLEAQVRSKSGLASVAGLTVLNSPGTVDPPYRGEIGVILYNANQQMTPVVMDVLMDVLEGSAEVADLHDAYDTHIIDNTLHIKRGQKLAQLVYAQFVSPEHTEVIELPPSGRGFRGFGSSGG